MSKSGKASKAKATKAAKPPAPDPRQLNAPALGRFGDIPTYEGRVAAIANSPEVGAAASVCDINRQQFGETDITQTALQLMAAADRVKAGDLSDLEAMLASQARTLDRAFHELTRIGWLNIQLPLTAREYLSLALRAQGQCRATVEALAEIKNPRAVFVKAGQANFAAGLQQVNNASAPRARETQIQRNELLEAPNEQALDTGTAGGTVGSHQAVEAVGTINGTPDR